MHSSHVEDTGLSKVLNSLESPSRPHCGAALGPALVISCGVTTPLAQVVDLNRNDASLVFKKLEGSMVLEEHGWDVLGLPGIHD